MIGVYHGTRAHIHIDTRTHTHTSQKSIASTCLPWPLPLFLIFFLPCRYLPFNSIKIFKQPNWKQLPGKIKLHKQNYPDRLRLILGIWALLGSSNNSTGAWGGGTGEEAIFCRISSNWTCNQKVSLVVLRVSVCVYRSCALHDGVYLSTIRAGADVKP